MAKLVIVHPATYPDIVQPIVYDSVGSKLLQPIKKNDPNYTGLINNLKRIYVEWWESTTHIKTRDEFIREFHTVKDVSAIADTYFGYSPHTADELLRRDESQKREPLIDTDKYKIYLIGSGVLAVGLFIFYMNKRYK